MGFIFGRPNPAKPAPPGPAALPRELPQAKRLKAWGGLPAAAREPGKYTSDAGKRKQAAISALDLVKAWAQGNHAQARASMSAEDLRDFEERFVATFSRGASVACRINSFHYVERWCAHRARDVWALQWADVQSYMWTPSRSGRVSAAIARKRFHDLAWLRKHWGFPVGLAGQVPPATAQAGSVFEEKQAVPVDPAWMLAVEAAWEQAKPLSPQDTSLCMCWMIWISAVRLQQLQRSQFTALTSTALWAVCSLGKGSAGFRWAIPRHTTAGADIGAHIFRCWNSWSSKSGSPLPSVVFELASGAPLTYQHTRKIITDALSQVGLVHNLERATTYSLRRGCATMVAIWADQAEQEANGFWLSKRSSHMPDRYHGQRVQRSLIVKLTNRELLNRARRGSRALSWNHWGVAIAGLDVQEARETANALEAEAVLEAWTPKEWAGIPALPVAFSGAPVVPTETKVDSGASSAPTPTVSGEESEPETSSDSDSSEPESPKEAPAEAAPCGAASAAQNLALQAMLDSQRQAARAFPRSRGINSPLQAAQGPGSSHASRACQCMRQ